MMKKIGVFCLVLCVGFLSVSCSIVDQLGLSKTTITIYNGEESYQAEITNLSQRNVVDVPVKDGYYLKGIYDETDGGTRFFNGIGQTLEPWSRKDSKELYCQWGTLNEIDFRSKEISKEKNGSHIYFVFENLSADLLAAIQGNPSRSLYITIHYTVKGSSYFADEFDFTVYTKADDKKHGETSIRVDDEWDARTTTIQITGQGFDENELKLYFNTNNSSLVANERVHVKEIYVEIRY